MQESLEEGATFQSTSVSLVRYLPYVLVTTGALILICTVLPLWEEPGLSTFSGLTLLTSHPNYLFVVTGRYGSWAMTGIWTILFGAALVTIGLLSRKKQKRNLTVAASVVSALSLGISIVARIPKGDMFSNDVHTSFGGWLFIAASAISLAACLAALLIEWRTNRGSSVELGVPALKTPEGDTSATETTGGFSDD